MASRKITLSKAANFCTRSSDEFHPRKQNRNVRSIHTSLDENNYELIDMSKVEEEEVVVVLGKKKRAVANSMTWTTEQPPQIVR